jgi:hypothetical protein
MVARGNTVPSFIGNISSATAPARCSMDLCSTAAACGADDEDAIQVRSGTVGHREFLLESQLCPPAC